MALVLTITDPDGNTHACRLGTQPNRCFAVDLSNGETVHVQQCTDLETGQMRIDVRSALRDDWISTLRIPLDPGNLPDESVFEVCLNTGTEITIGKSCLRD